MKTFVDSHCHLSDLRFQDSGLEIIKNAHAKGVAEFLLAGVDPDDWQRQTELIQAVQTQLKRSDENELSVKIWPVFGLHPYFVNSTTSDECEQALDLLVQKISKAYALGETGLDFRTSILSKSCFAKHADFESLARAHQIDYFEKQIELAVMSSKPLILHVVRAFDEAIKCIENADHLLGREQKGLVHAFNGSAPQALKWCELGFKVSIGAAVLKPDNVRLHQAVVALPLNSLCLETDSPDQPPPGRTQNDPTVILEIASKVAALKKCEHDEILDICSQNTRQLIGYGNKSK